MKFQRRDVLLLVASLFFIIGLSPFMPLIYAMVIGVGLFFGVKVVYEQRKKTLEKKFATGICYSCGQKLANDKCPQCDLNS